MSVLLSSLLVSGCAGRYQITQQNGNRITTLGKPKYDRGWYVYRDVNGQTNTIPEGRVREIGPQPRGFTEESAFTPSRK